MRVLWFISISLMVFLAGILTSIELLWILEILVIDLFFTRIIPWEKSGFKMPVRISLWVNILLWITLSTILLRLFVFESVTVRNTGMQPEIRPGDNIIISKIIFGPRLPMTPVNFPFTHHYLPFSTRRSYMYNISIPYTRLGGIRGLKRGDVVAYNFPEGDTVFTGEESVSYYGLKRAGKIKVYKSYTTEFRPVDRRGIEISRIVAVQGDTIEFYSGDIYINSIRESNEKDRYPYLLSKDLSPQESGILKEFDIYPDEVSISPGRGFILNLTQKEADKVKIRLGMSSLTELERKMGSRAPQIFPHDQKYNWNPDFFGPVVVPFKGQTVELTEDNICLYERIIRVYEGNQLLVSGSDIYINDTLTSHYKIKMNYCFITGDNRELSRDSRHWGFLPEDHIIGKPWLIWLSLSSHYGNNKLKWNRIFDVIN
jgi:signal peptidase I